MSESFILLVVIYSLFISSYICWFKLRSVNGLTNPPVENLRSKQATTEPRSWAIQYKIPLMSVMWPPRKAPNVTAGFTWPPEMFAPIATATNSAKAWARAAATSPAGVVDPSSVSLSAKKHHSPISFSFYWMSKKENEKHIIILKVDLPSRYK